jgi:anti-sigma regulatory factor (Ser/Thr protein kinase)
VEVSGQNVLVAIGDASAVAEARHRAATLARRASLDETAAGELAIAVTEAAGNIVKHAGRGSLLLRVLDGGDCAGVEALALDQGPGIANVAESMRDGHSTAGSPGTGLGALRRMTTGFELWSAPGKGTIARFEVWPKAPGAPAKGRWSAGAVSVAKPGEDVSGDDWLAVERSGRLMLFMTDGLGHGPAAASAAHAAVAAARKHAAMKPHEIMEEVHAALRPTRGAAGAVALVQPDKGLCNYCGIGNISACVRNGGLNRSMVSHNGILGHQVRKIQDFQYPFPAGGLLIAHSDGIGTHWDLASYPGLELRHPSLVAAALYRDHCRGRDDATVVAVRMEAA